MNTIGERVRELRTKKRLSMDALAKSIAIPLREKDTNKILAYKPTTSASISNIENDRHRPSLDMAIALAEFFQVSLDWLILGKGNSPENIVEFYKTAEIQNGLINESQSYMYTTDITHQISQNLIEQHPEFSKKLKEYISATVAEEVKKQSKK